MHGACRHRPDPCRRPGTIDHSNGFTLIEILVTLVLIGIVMGIALLRLDINSIDSRVQREAARLTRIMELADQEAVLQAREIGLYFNKNAYRFLVLANENQWQGLDDPLLKPHEIPAEIEVKLTVDGTTDLNTNPSSEEPRPQIIFTSSGEWTQFEIVLSAYENPQVAWLIGNLETGQLKTERLDYDFR